MGMESRPGPSAYVDDLIDGLVRLMDSEPAVTGPLNIGNPVEITVRELAETVIRLIGARSQIVWRPLPQDDPMQRCPDITRVQSLLNWQPHVDLEHGLRQTIDYFRGLIARSTT